jgi:phosphoenolpyruvate carboxylase
VPSIATDLADAVRYLDRDRLAWLPSRARESVERGLALVDVREIDEEHVELSREMRRLTESGGALTTELVVRAAALRHFLG